MKLTSGLSFLSLFILLILPATSAAEVCDGASFQDTISLKETRTLSVFGQTYNVTLWAISNQKAKFIIKDEVTDALYTGEYHTMSDSLFSLGVSNIGGNSSGYCILNPLDVDCSSLDTPNKQDSCYLRSYANWGNYSVCELINNPDLEEACNALRDQSEHSAPVVLLVPMQPL